MVDHGVFSFLVPTGLAVVGGWLLCGVDGGDRALSVIEAGTPTQVYALAAILEVPGGFLSAARGRHADNAGTVGVHVTVCRLLPSRHPIKMARLASRCSTLPANPIPV
jgi:hypothetical protein